MARRRFIQIPGQGLVEVTDDYQAPSRQNADGVLWGDRSYEGMVATDGTDISSRTKHREYMRANNLTTVDDFKGQWEKQQAARDAYRTTGKGGAVRPKDVARAIQQLQNRGR